MSPWQIELASDVVPLSVEWLYPGYLARDKLALLDGDPEMGKSLLTIDLIARLSRGQELPDGSTFGRPCTAIILTAEDSREDTICPRLEAAGADLSRVVLPRFVGRLPRFPDDLSYLRELIEAADADLVAIDPLLAFLPPKVSANLDQCVRQALSPLAELAEQTQAAILMIRHLTKRRMERAVYRGQGSMGIVAAVRTALLAAVHPQKPAERVLTVVKSNLGLRPPAQGYRVFASPVGQPMIEWTGPVDLSADAASRGEGPVRNRERAIDWLKRQLANGPRRAAELHAAAADAGIPEATLHRAKAQLPAESQRIWISEENRGEWWWYDPDAPWPADAPFRKPRELRPLGWL
jgi:hypothetical protein